MKKVINNNQSTSYYFPFGQKLHKVVQEDTSPKNVFILGVYGSAVHAKWENNGKTICKALAVASEPHIFWDGNEEEAKKIIESIKIPPELGKLELAKSFNGPSGRILDENILAPLNFSRNDVWLCDCLPHALLNQSQYKVILQKYNPLIEKYGLNPVTIPKKTSIFCDENRIQEITDELMKSDAKLLITLGNIPIEQYLKEVSDFSFSDLSTYVDSRGYGTITETIINGKKIKILPLTHPRQIGGLGTHSQLWRSRHKEWENKIVNIKNKNEYFFS